MSNSQQEPVKAQKRTADHSTLNDKVFVEAQDLGLAICGLAVQGRAGQGRAGQGKAGQGRAGQGRARPAVNGRPGRAV